MIKLCKKCVTPSTRPRVVFNKDGVCNACINSEEKKSIDWNKRREEFKKIIIEIKDYKTKNNLDHDCIVPWSGGKDSTSIALKLKLEWGLNPLLVTCSPLILNQIGQENRELLLQEGFDNVFVRPNQKIAKILARRFFIERGNPKVAWDAGVNSIPVKTAINFKIPYIFYAEHGESEYGGLVLHEDSKKIRDLEEVIEHQIGDFPENWVNDKVKIDDLYFYKFPSEEVLKKNKVKSMYFSYFFKWSMADNYDYVKDVMPEFKTNEYGRTTGTFTDFDSLDDKIDDLYYYMQFIKFGFGRAVRDTSRFIQNDRMTREEAIEIVKKYDGEYPERNLSEVIKFLNMTNSEFTEIIDKHRNNEIWENKGNFWELKNKLF